MRLVVEKDAAACSRFVADAFERVIKEKPTALLGLATGGSVTDLYRMFREDYSAGRVDFSEVSTVNLDEYVGLPGDHKQSFAWFMEEHLFSKTNIPRKNVHLYDGSGDAELETAKMKAFLDENVIDILLLGIGNNGHIGFNEPDAVFTCAPHAVELAEETIAANARFFSPGEEVPKYGMTIGMRDVVRAKKVILVAFGAAKAAAIAALFGDDLVDPQLPCSTLKLAADAVVVVDEALAASANLSR